MKWIRWQGLISFLVIVIIFTIIWLFFIDGFVKRMIEKTGSRSNGARVELDKADLTLFPAGLTLNRLQVTNPDKPMTNTLEIQKITMSLDGLNLLRRKVIIEEMTVDGVRFNTARKTSGAMKFGPTIVGKVLEKDLCADAKFSLPSLDIPSVEDILKKEDLQSLKDIESLRSAIKGENNSLSKQLANLPGKNQFDEYKKRIEKIKSGSSGGVAGMLGSAAELKSIQDEIKRDLDNIKGAQKEFMDKAASLKSRVQEVTKEPLKDVRRLKDKYSLSALDLEGISQKLLSSRLCGWMKKAMEMYEKSKPVLERAKEAGKGETGPEAVKPLRGKGVDVRFKEHSPLPDFYIRLANVSVLFNFGELAGKINDITPDQDILGIPLTFKFSGKGLKGVKSINLNGELNHINPLTPEDAANLVVTDYRLKDLVLSQSETLPMVLKDGLADLRVDATYKNDRIKTEIMTGLQSVKISTALENKKGALADAIVTTLSDIKNLDIKAVVSGTLEDYDISLSSNLDRLLKNAMGNLVKAKANELEKGLMSSITAKVNGPLNGLNGDLVSFDNIGKGFTERLDLGNNLLKDSVATGSPAGKITNGLKLPF